MRFMKSLGIGALAFIAVILISSAIGSYSRKADQVAIVIGIIVTVGMYIYYGKPTELIARTMSAYQDAKEEIASKVDGDSADLYGEAEREITENRVDPGVWSQAYVKANGQEALRKVEYIKLRVKQLKKS